MILRFNINDSMPQLTSMKLPINQLSKIHFGKFLETLFSILNAKFTFVYKMILQIKVKSICEIRPKQGPHSGYNFSKGIKIIVEIGACLTI